MSTTPDTEPSTASRLRRLSLPIAALIGLLSIAAAVASGHLLAGWVGGSASPYRAVNNSVRDVSPSAVVEWAKENLGTNDKLYAQIGTAAMLVLFGLVAGVLSRRSYLPGVVLAVLLGGVGIAAVLSRPDLGQLGILAPVVSLVVGAAVFYWLHALAMRQVDADTSTEASGQSRRTFLQASGGVAVGAGVLGVGGEWLINRVDVEGSRAAVGATLTNDLVRAPGIPAGADFVKDGTPDFITSNDRFYRIDTAFTLPRIRAEDWRLRLHGMVDNEKTFTFDDIRKRGLVEKTITMTCVSNEVGGSLISTATFIGVPLRDLLLEAGVKQGAEQVFSTSDDGWTAGTPVDALLDERRGALLAIGMNGEPLPIEHGFPARMVVPGLYGFVSATKWVTDLEVTTFGARQSYWLKRGWSEKAPIKTQSRIDTPRGLAALNNGKVPVAGISWAQNTGVDTVEVRLDGGPWQETELATEVGNQTWRMWRTTVDVPNAGTHRVECRATDRSGYTQTDQRAQPIPDGASGWHSIVFTTQ